MPGPAIFLTGQAGAGVATEVRARAQGVPWVAGATTGLQATFGLLPGRVELLGLRVAGLRLDGGVRVGGGEAGLGVPGGGGIGGGEVGLCFPCGSGAAGRGVECLG